MKKSVLFVLFALVICMFCLVSCGEKAAESDKAVNAYCDFMEQRMLHEWHFALAYIDEDDIPELIIADGNYHAASASIYTYAGGEIKEVGSAGSWGRFDFAPQKNSVASYYSNMGEYIATFFNIKDGVFEQVKYFYDDHGTRGYSSDITTYKIDDNEVLEEEYYTELERMKTECIYVTVGYDNGFVVGESLNELKDNWQSFLIEEDDVTAIEAYCNFMAKENFNEWHFALAYIDEDDIPELVVADSDAHAASADIYTYIDGEVTKVGSAGSWGGFQFAPRKNYIVHSYADNGIGEIFIAFCDIKNGTLEDIKCFYTLGGSTDTIASKIDDREVSEEEYDTELESMRGTHTYLAAGYNNQYVIGDCLSELRDSWQNFLVEE